MTTPTTTTMMALMTPPPAAMAIVKLLLVVSVGSDMEAGVVVTSAVVAELVVGVSRGMARSNLTRA